MARQDLSNVWLRFLGSRENIQALEAVSTWMLVSGALVYVISERSYYSFNKESTQTADGGQVVAPSHGPGRWLRFGTTNPWETQPDWYIDANNGFDGNDGLTAATALRSREELTRRIGNATLRQVTRIHLLSGPAEPEDAFSFRGVLAADSILWIIGEGPTVLYDTTSAGTPVTGVVPRAIGTTSTVTVAGLDWAASGLVGKRCRITSSSSGTPVGTIFWVEAASGDTAEISTASNPANASVTQIAIGDEFVVEELTELGPCVVDWIPDGTARNNSVCLILESVKTVLGATLQLVSSYGVLRSIAAGEWIDSQLRACDLQSNPLKLVATQVTSCRISSHNHMFLETQAGETQWRACSFDAGTSIRCRAGSHTFSNHCSVTRAWLSIGFESRAATASITISEGMSIRNVASAGGALRVSTGGNATLNGVLWGTSTVANTTGIAVASGAHCEYAAGSQPTISGALATQIRVGGVDGTYAGLPASGQDPATNNAWLVQAAT